MGDIRCFVNSAGRILLDLRVMTSVDNNADYMLSVTQRHASQHHIFIVQGYLAHFLLLT